jgi:hypothetical protein
MNTISIFLISFLSITLIVFFLLARRTLKITITRVNFWKNTSDKYKNDLNILTDQYRQLANINKALRDIQTVKGGKKK